MPPASPPPSLPARVHAGPADAGRVPSVPVQSATLRASLQPACWAPFHRPENRGTTRPAGCSHTGTGMGTSLAARGGVPDSELAAAERASVLQQMLGVPPGAGCPAAVSAFRPGSAHPPRGTQGTRLPRRDPAPANPAFPAPQGPPGADAPARPNRLSPLQAGVGQGCEAFAHVGGWLFSWEHRVWAERVFSEN